MLALLVAVLITIPAIDLQVAAEPDEEPSNLLFVERFDRLDELKLWDSVVLTDDFGTEQQYVVAWSRLYPTGALPPEVTDGPASGGRVITLITDAPLEEGMYPQQRVVRAVTPP